MRRLMALLVCSLLAACAAAPPAAQPPGELFADQRFAAPTQHIAAADIFALSDAMKQYLRTEIAGHVRSRGPQQALLEALTRRGQLKLEYDSAMTRNAAQAFDARAGNCLSLVIMTAAFAKEMGLRVEYQSAFLEETWSRSGNIYLRSGHVNLTLGHRFAQAGSLRDLSALTIDFLPPEDIRGLRTRTIDESTVVAMYLNNRAAEALVRGEVDDAYWWAREAIHEDPGFFGAYNTLGVVYMHHGNMARADRVFSHVLAHEPDNTRAMFNLAQAYTAQHRADEANVLYRRLAQLEPDPPFHFFNLGMAAMRRDDFHAARDLFAKEVARAGYYHEFHFWLGLANYRLGNLGEAKKELALAQENSTTRGDHDLYAAKLAWLESRRRP